MTEAVDTGQGRASAIGFGAANLVSATLVYVGVFEGLPARYWLVDGAAAVIMVLFAAAGAGLLGNRRWAPRVALLASTVSLVLGLLLITTLALTASYLSGIYGPVGRGGALILSLLAATALPYLVALPVAQLAWLRRRRPAALLAAPRARSES
jgi:hypothetical protein